MFDHDRHVEGRWEVIRPHLDDDEQLLAVVDGTSGFGGREYLLTVVTVGLYAIFYLLRQYRRYAVAVTDRRVLIVRTAIVGGRALGDPLAFPRSSVRVRDLMPGYLKSTIDLQLETPDGPRRFAVTRAYLAEVEDLLAALA